MSDKQKPEAKEETGQEDILEAAAEEAAVDNHPPRKSRHHVLWWLLVLLAVAGFVITNYMPEVHRSLMATLKLDTLIPGQGEPEVPEGVEPASEQPAVTPARMTPAETAPAIETAPAASSEEVARLLDAIASLERQLGQISDEQRAITKAQQQLQTTQLRARLTWIGEPSSRLPQIQQAWKEITMLPFLSPQEHQLAGNMYALASKRQGDIRNWQQQLRSLAAQLTVEEGENIIPSSDNPWFKWLRDQFSLRPSPTVAEQQDQRLARQLSDAAQHISLEQWPEERGWRTLRAELQLRLPDTATSEPTLPDDFSAVSQDIAQLRLQARNWLERL